MKDFIYKGNVALMLFAVRNINIKDKQKEFLVWSKMIDSFHFDDEVVYNLIFINHPLETYVGISIRSNCSILEEKMKRYSEGLAYLLVYYFRDSDIRVLNQDECITIVGNLATLDKIPMNMCAMEGGYLDGPNDKLQILFARIVNPKIILDKFYDFYSSYRTMKSNSIENRIGVKQKCDERILTVLQNAYLAYSFKYFPTVEVRNKEVMDSSGHEVPRSVDFVRDFVDVMGVPDTIVEKVKGAKSSFELFDSPEIVLVPPETVAGLILGYK